MEMQFLNKNPNDWKMMEQRGFSKELKEFLINRAYYSIEEFVIDNVN